MYNLIKGLQIFEKHGCTWIGTDHYSIHAGDVNLPFTEEEREFLEHEDSGWNDYGEESYSYFV